jgi:hypothetical protein
MMLAIAFIMLRYILSIPSFIRAFIMKRCWILLKDFSISIFIFASVNMLYYIIYICWTILVSLVWNWLDPGVWPFW